MSDQIFISHSREDKDLLDELDRVFGKVGLKQYRASFEDQSPAVSEDLKSQINDSVGMFVVLGRRAQAKTHTMIWIGWEAGIAIQAGIPVWILEDMQSNVTQPIPSFTDYVLWNSQENKQKRILRDVIENEFVNSRSRDVTEYFEPQTKDSNSLVGQNRNNANVRNSQVNKETQGIRCPYDDCGEKFVIRFEGPSEFNCPSCRQAVVLEEESDPYSW